MGILTNSRKMVRYQTSMDYGHFDYSQKEQKLQTNGHWINGHWANGHWTNGH